MSNIKTLDNCDVVIVGGGVSSTICAHTLATAGLKVNIVSNHSSLMHEIGLSRLNVQNTEEIRNQFESVDTWFKLILQFNGYKDAQIDPILVQLLSDRYLKEQSVDILYEVKPIKPRIDRNGMVEGIDIATRAGIYHIPCRVIVDCSESALIVSQMCDKSAVGINETSIFWTLTTINYDSLIEDEEFSFSLNDRKYDVRTEPSYLEDGLCIRVAMTSPMVCGENEIGFMSKLEDVFKQIKNQADKNIGDLVHVSERPWCPSSFWIENTFSSGVSTYSGSVVGTGCWIESIEKKVREATLWEKGNIAMREAMSSGVETGHHILKGVQAINR